MAGILATTDDKTQCVVGLPGDMIYDGMMEAVLAHLGYRKEEKQVELTALQPCIVIALIIDTSRLLMHC